MERVLDPAGLEIVFRDECFRMLGTSGIGRIAVVRAGRPVIFPVNYAVSGDDVVFRTDPGTKLEGIHGGAVAFEIDAIDPMYHAGWSVLVQGRAEEVTDPAAIAELERLPLRPWVAGEKRHWVRIHGEAVTGRRIPRV